MVASSEMALLATSSSSATFCAPPRCTFTSDHTATSTGHTHHAHGDLVAPFQRVRARRWDRSWPVSPCRSPHAVHTPLPRTNTSRTTHSKMAIASAPVEEVRQTPNGTFGGVHVVFSFGGAAAGRVGAVAALGGGRGVPPLHDRVGSALGSQRSRWQRRTFGRGGGRSCFTRRPGTRC